MAATSPRRVRLGARLRELRARRFPSGSAFARALDWQQTKVSKIELGQQVPTNDEIEVWAEAAGATAQDTAELVDLLTAARLGEYRAWNEAWRSPGGIAAAQDEIIEIDARSTVIAEYQPSMVPGLAHTPAYARASLSVPGGPPLLDATSGKIEQLVAGRLRRQQVLYTPGKRVHLLMGEAALRVRFGEDSNILAGQLDRLTAVAGLPNVDVAVLRFDRPSPVLPVAGFALNDDEVAFVETFVGDQRIDDPEQVAAYAAALRVGFEAARADGTVGPGAVALIQRALRGLSHPRV